MGGESARGVVLSRMRADTRHWVRERGKPSLEVRPLVGAGDDAVMEAVYDYWRLAYEHDVAKGKA